MCPKKEEVFMTKSTTRRITNHQTEKKKGGRVRDGRGVGDNFNASPVDVV